MTQALCKRNIIAPLVSSSRSLEQPEVDGAQPLRHIRLASSATVPNGNSRSRHKNMVSTAMGFAQHMAKNPDASSTTRATESSISFSATLFAGVAYVPLPAIETGISRSPSTSTTAMPLYPVCQILPSARLVPPRERKTYDDMPLEMAVKDPCARVIRHVPGRGEPLEMSPARKKALLTEEPPILAVEGLWCPGMAGRRG